MVQARSGKRLDARRWGQRIRGYPAAMPRARDPVEDFDQRQRSAMLQVARSLTLGTICDPEDLVHEAFERVLRLPERPAIASTQAYLCSVMKNLFVDWCRSSARAPARLPDQPPEQDPAPPAEAESLWAQVGDAELLAAIERLHPERLRQAYELHAQGLRYREIAAKLRAPEGTIATWLHEARKQLRQRLTGRVAP